MIGKSARRKKNKSKYLSLEQASVVSTSLLSELVVSKAAKYSKKCLVLLLPACRTPHTGDEGGKVKAIQRAF